MDKWFYKNHLGGFYLTDEERPVEDLYCEECGDSDTPLGMISSMVDGWDRILEDIQFNVAGGGYQPEYIVPVLMPAATPHELEILNKVCGKIEVGDYGLCNTQREQLFDAIREMGGTIGYEEADDQREVL